MVGIPRGNLLGARGGVGQDDSATCHAAVPFLLSHCGGSPTVSSQFFCGGACSPRWYPYGSWSASLRAGVFTVCGQLLCNGACSPRWYPYDRRSAWLCRRLRTVVVFPGFAVLLCGGRHVCLKQRHGDAYSDHRNVLLHSCILAPSFVNVRCCLFSCFVALWLLFGLGILGLRASRDVLVWPGSCLCQSYFTTPQR